MSEQEEEITLTFRVPETDFDYSDLAIALDWIQQQLERIDYPLDRAGGLAAHRVLNKIHAQYVEKLGEPNWKRADLPFYK